MLVTFTMQLNDIIKRSSSNSISPIAGAHMNDLCSKTYRFIFLCGSGKYEQPMDVVIIEVALLHNLERTYHLFFLKVRPCQVSCCG